MSFLILLKNANDSICIFNKYSIDFVLNKFLTFGGIKLIPLYFLVKYWFNSSLVIMPLRTNTNFISCSMTSFKKSHILFKYTVIF